MNHSFWQSVASTPWWIMAVVSYLFWAGFLATKPRVVPIKHITFKPLLPLLLSVGILFFIFPLTAFNSSLWIGGALLGTGSGFLQFRLSRIKVIDGTSNLYIPGSWSLFFFLTAVLAAKLYYGFTVQFNQALFFNPVFAAGLFLLYGLMMGLFLGRTYGAQVLVKQASR